MQGPPQGIPLNDPNGGNLTQIAVLQNLVLQLSQLNATLQTVFPQGQAITATAGAASGNYLTLQGSDGNTYKIELLDP